MKITLIVIASVVLFNLAVCYPFKIKAALHINFLEDVGFGAVKVFAFKLFCAKFKLSPSGKLEVNSAVKKKKKKKKGTLIKKCYKKSLIKFLHIKKFEILLDIGYKDNAYFVSMLSGYLSVLSSSAIAVLQNKYKCIKTFHRINPIYSDNRLEVSGSLVVSFSLLHMVMSIVYAYWCFIKEKLKGASNG